MFIKAADLDRSNVLYPNNAGFAYYKEGEYDFSHRVVWKSNPDRP